MSEHDMRQEIERLRRELAEVREERERLHKTARHMLLAAQFPLTDDEIEQMKQVSPASREILRSLLPSERQALAGDVPNAAAQSTYGSFHDIERLRQELAVAKSERTWVHRIVCRLLPIDDPDVVEKQVLEMMQQPRYGIEDIIQELLADDQPSNQIPA